MKYVCLFLFLLFSACVKRVEKIAATYPDGTKKTVCVYEGTDQIKTEETGYYHDGTKKIHGHYDAQGKRDGIWEYYYQNGKLWSKCSYSHGARDGLSVVWYENGQKRYEGAYALNKQEGVWRFWNQEGKMVHEQDFGHAK